MRSTNQAIETASEVDESTRAALAEDTLAGLSRPSKTLPAWMFYDRSGSDLFEQITDLPEYYVTRTERAILQQHADDIVRTVVERLDLPLKVAELGAGSAKKTQLILDAVVGAQGRCHYLPIDVSHSALTEAVARLRREAPKVVVRPFTGTHIQALPAIRELGARRLVLFLGSSVGNYSDQEAIALLAAVAQQLDPGDALLVGADCRKEVATLLRAYDDGAGVTAAFNLNILVRLNRDLGADFDVESFRHEARWNEERSCVEMHLVSSCAQRVNIENIGTFPFAAGESIHTESRTKYTRPHMERLLEAAGFERTTTFNDPDELFGLHLARRT